VDPLNCWNSDQQEMGKRKWLIVEQEFQKLGGMVSEMSAISRVVTPITFVQIFIYIFLSFIYLYLFIKSDMCRHLIDAEWRLTESVKIFNLI
jgi:hypothetical protein